MEPSFFKPRKRFNTLAKVLVGMLTGAVVSAIASLPAQSAERIQFFVGPFEPTIYVDDLETFATTGEIVDRLKPFANRLNSEQRQALRGMLMAQYDLSPIPVAQFTYSTFGEDLLSKLGQVVQTDSFLNGMKGIRASLILAAADEAQGGFTPINILRHFPSNTIQIDFSLAQRLITENNEIFRRRDQVVAGIKQLAQAQALDNIDLSSTGDPRSAGRYTWDVNTLTFQNPNRDQSSIADIYLPQKEAAGSTPVVIISHGVASDRKTFAYLSEHLASHGYAVAALEHTETSAERFMRFLWGQEGPPSSRDLLLRPQDITALLDTLSDQQATDPALKDLNLNSVGLLGQSLGGYTVLAASGAVIDSDFLFDECESDLGSRPTLNLSLFLQCTLLDLPVGTDLTVADPRVAAVIALNPVTSSIFGRSGLKAVQVPVMMMAGTNDFVAPALPEQIEPFDWLDTEHKALVVMERGTHFSFLDRESQSVLPFSQSFTGPDPLAAREPTQALSLAFFNRHLQQKNDFEQFLNQAYLNEFPTEPFQFSVVDSLPLAE